MEPDLKNGHGGLRDIQLIDALAAAQLVDRPAGDVLGGPRTLLLDVRTELHRLAGRARDVLRAQDADEIAAALDIADRFELARALSGAARAVAFAAEVGLRPARNALPRRGLAALRRAPVRRPLDTGVVEHAGEVALARDAAAARDPALVLRVAATAARTGLPIAAGTLHRLADTAPELREPWPRAALGELLSLLGTGRAHGRRRRVAGPDRAVGAAVPGVGRGARPAAARPRATSGPSTGTSSRPARRRPGSRPGWPGRTCCCSARCCTTSARAAAATTPWSGSRWPARSGGGWAVAESDVDLLGAMVRHHLLLPHTATRRDLDDPATVTRVLRHLDGTRCCCWTCSTRSPRRTRWPPGPGCGARGGAP